MELKQGRCTTCGANIEVDPAHLAGVCSFCGNAYVSEKAIQNTVVNNITNINHHHGYHTRQPSQCVIVGTGYGVSFEKKENPIALIGVIFAFINIIVMAIVFISGIVVGSVTLALSVWGLMDARKKNHVTGWAITGIVISIFQIIIGIILVSVLSSIIIPFSEGAW